MKTKIGYFYLVIAAFMLMVVGCTDTIDKMDETLKSGSLKKQKQEQKQEQEQEEKQENHECVNQEVLTPEDIEGIYFMREEEKLAYDLYVEFFDLWSHQVFYNISESEEVHEDAILELMDHFNLEDSVYSEPGMYYNNELQQMYDSLLAVGSDSLVAALYAGAYVEEADVIDIDYLIGLTSVKVIQIVYGNLLKGSKNHLRAFVYVLDVLGYTYVPVLLDPLYYAEIIAEDPH